MELFLVTETGSKSRIRANMKLIDLPSAIQHIKESRYGDLRYCELNKSVYLLNEISLEQYERMFKDAGFTEDEVTKNFSKEVSLKYGKHKTMAVMKKIPSKDLVRGGIYKMADGNLNLYLGEVHRVVTHKKRYEKDNVKEDVTGHGFAYLYDLKQADNLEYYKIRNCVILKNCRPFVEKVGQIEIDTQDVNHEVEQKSFYSSSSTTVITMLKFL